jgi:hypothetical protein
LQAPVVIIGIDVKPHTPKQPVPSLHPQAQVIVTGKPLSPEQAVSVVSFADTMSFNGWCSPEGTIGHLDGFLKKITYGQLLEELEALANAFPFLDMGVTVMSGPPGSPVLPVLSLKLQNRNVKRVSGAHFGHPPPKRLKPKV